MQTVFDAATDYQFSNQLLTCSESEQCTVRCDQNYACKGATVTCPSNYQCNIYCSAYASCHSIQINPPQDQSLFTLVSNGQRALYSVNLPLVSYRDDYTNYTLTCNGGFETCGWTRLTCPQYAHCTIDCISNGACKAIRLNCPAEAEWECNINCLNSQSCLAANIYAVNADQVNLNCAQASFCNNLVLSYNPTSEPTADPTFYPTG